MGRPAMNGETLPDPTACEERQVWVVRQSGYRVERNVVGTGVEIQLHELADPVQTLPMTPYVAGQLARALLAAQQYPDGSWASDGIPMEHPQLRHASDCPNRGKAQGRCPCCPRFGEDVPR